MSRSSFHEFSSERSGKMLTKWLASIGEDLTQFGHKYMRYESEKKLKHPSKFFGYSTRIKCRNLAIFINYFSNSGNGKPKIQIIFASLIFEFNTRKKKKKSWLDASKSYIY